MAAPFAYQRLTNYFVWVPVVLMGVGRIYHENMKGDAYQKWKISMFQSYKPVTPVVLFLWDIGGLILEKHTRKFQPRMIGLILCVKKTVSSKEFPSDLAAQHGPPLNTNQDALPFIPPRQLDLTWTILWSWWKMRRLTNDTAN